MSNLANGGLPRLSSDTGPCYSATWQFRDYSWWRHLMETFSALLPICAGHSPVPGEFPSQRPVTRSFDVYFDLRLNKRLSKQSWGWWFETLSRPFIRQCNEPQGQYRNEISWVVNYVSSLRKRNLNMMKSYNYAMYSTDNCEAKRWWWRI